MEQPHPMRGLLFIHSLTYFWRRRFPALALCLSLLLLAPGCHAQPSPPPSLSVAEENGELRVTSPSLDVQLSLTQPGIDALTVDSLGLGKRAENALRPPKSAVGSYTARRVPGSEMAVEYRRAGQPDTDAPGWRIAVSERRITLVSQFSEAEKPDPLVLDFDLERCHVTLLGLMTQDGGTRLPAVLHLPGQGSLRLTSPGQAQAAAIGYESGPGFVHVSFPAATQAIPRVEYHLDAAAIYPKLPGTDSDPRFQAFKRNWLNILQLNPSRRMLSNNSASDTCALCYYEYGDIALHSPPLADNLNALDIMRQTLDSVLSGTPTYGMPTYSYGPYSENSADTYPSLLIAADDCVQDSRGPAWCAKNYTGIKQWADKMLATDTTGNGLIKYGPSGNSGSWDTPGPHPRPANWWDTIGYGHEDAYSNALAYRALLGMEQMARIVKKPADAAHYHQAAQKLRAAYFPAFFNPATGILAGWRSADGQLHDYYFLYISGIAIDYGLVPAASIKPIQDHLLAKLKAVGYTRFDLGLPGNLVSVAEKDYREKNVRYGGGVQPDNADGFQLYENGGATACFEYFTLAALYHQGRRTDADALLFPMLASISKGGFEGRGPNGLTYDWKKWDGTPAGYEGFLGDNYYSLLAVLARK